MSIPTLAQVKNAMGVTGAYQDNTLQAWLDETVAFIRDAGVSPADITVGVVARGVLDLWNYGAGEGAFSEYFKMRVSQLSYKT